MTKLYQIYDMVAEECSPPFMAKNDVLAKRIFKEAIKNHVTPQDFRLYDIADMAEGNFGVMHGEDVLRQREIIMTKEETDE